MRKSDKSSPYGKGSGTRDGSRPARKPDARKPATGATTTKARADNPWQRSRAPESKPLRSDEGRAPRAGRDQAPARKGAGPGAGERPRRQSERAPRGELPRKPRPATERAALPEPVRSDSGLVERKIYGLNAALAFVRERADDIIRGYFTEAAARKHFGQLMKTLAQTRRAYHIVDTDELAKVTESTHHEGVCLLVRDVPVARIGDWLGQAPATAHMVLALEGVANPHNLGAIMRTAAHFGVAAIVTSGAERLRSGAAMRTAEGGAERIPLVEAAGFVDGLVLLQKAGYQIVVTSSHKGTSVFGIDWPDKVCLVMGEEQQGVSRPVLALADQCVSIPGTGAVESLNVSVASAIVVAQCAQAQQHRRRTPGTLRKAKPARGD